MARATSSANPTNHEPSPWAPVCRIDGEVFDDDAWRRDDELEKGRKAGTRLRQPHRGLGELHAIVPPHRSRQITEHRHMMRTGPPDQRMDDAGHAVPCNVGGKGIGQCRKHVSACYCLSPVLCHADLTHTKSMS